MMLQKIIDTLYRHPMSLWSQYQRFGGFWNYRSIQQAKRIMMKHACQLPSMESDPEGLPIYLLTGKDYFYQTLFCIKSLQRYSDDKYRFTLVDDGTFDQNFISKATSLLPGARIVKEDEIRRYQQSKLPESLFPMLHQKRKVYPHIKKLSDIHMIPEDDWKVVIDSDMLFFKNPAALSEWIKNPLQPLHMTDCRQSYGYTTALMSHLCGSPVPEQLNVGIIGLESNSIPWTAIEHWIRNMEQQEGTSYFLEQALSAMIIGNRKSTILSNTEYIVNPSSSEINNGTGTMHHYVDLSKEGYFKYAWKQL